MQPAFVICALLAGALSRQGAATAADKPFRVVCFGDSITGDRPRKPCKEHRDLALRITRSSREMSGALHL